MCYWKVYHDDVEPAFQEIDLPEDSRSFLDACYNALGCNSIEIVRTIISGLVLIIDEEGKLWDGWQQRINTAASILYGSDWDPIVGDAILARVDGENLVPLTKHDVKCVLKRFL